ncbi:hypothetical protein [Nocardia asiatica]|uniref:hypothetical protein n=1 Tax=Nocardia asiatica TaxID=209252 RepID=UPI003EDF29E7
MTTRGSGEMDPEVDDDDEHQRYARYRQELGRVLPEGESGMIEVVLGDPDTAMAEAAVVAHLDRRATELLDAPGFPDWAHAIGQVIGEREYLVRRLREWALLRSIRTGEEWTADQVRRASDWFQRKAVDLATSPAVLALTRSSRALPSSRFDSPLPKVMCLTLIAQAVPRRWSLTCAYVTRRNVRTWLAPSDGKKLRRSASCRRSARAPHAPRCSTDRPGAK